MNLRWWERLVLAAAIATTLIMVVLLAWIATAGAATLTFGATNARPAHNATLDDLDARARRFWSARHVSIAAGEIYLVDLDPRGVAAYTVDADIYLSAYDVGWAQAHPSSRSAGMELCADVFHEDGHRADVFDEAGRRRGISHTASGLMAPVPVTPWECVVWARDRARAAIAGRRP